MKTEDIEFTYRVLYKMYANPVENDFTYYETLRTIWMDYLHSIKVYFIGKHITLNNTKYKCTDVTSYSGKLSIEFYHQNSFYRRYLSEVNLNDIQ